MTTSRLVPSIHAHMVPPQFLLISIGKRLRSFRVFLWVPLEAEPKTKASGTWLVREVREAKSEAGRRSRSRGACPEVPGLGGSASASSGPEKRARGLLGRSDYSLTPVPSPQRRPHRPRLCRLRAPVASQKAWGTDAPGRLRCGCGPRQVSVSWGHRSGRPLALRTGPPGTAREGGPHPHRSLSVRGSPTPAASTATAAPAAAIASVMSRSPAYSGFLTVGRASAGLRGLPGGLTQPSPRGV